MTRDAAPVDEPVTTKGCPDNPANREKLPGGRDAATAREQEWRDYLRDLAIHNTFMGRTVLSGCDWSRKPKEALRAAA